MGKTNLVALKVYVDHETARRARLAAIAHGGNISHFVRTLLEERVEPDHRPARLERMTEYVVRGINKLLDDRDPSYRRALKEAHDKRYPGLSDAD